MKKILILLAAVGLLLNLWGCQAASAPDTAAATEAATVPAAQYVEVWREGEMSRIPVQIVSGQTGSYSIATDPEYFTFRPEDGSDLFLYEGWDTGLPVYYRISPYPAPYDPDIFIGQCTRESFSQSGVQTLTLGGYPATLVTLTGSGDAAGYCLHRYLVDCGEIRYCIEAQFTQEMYEGLYAIMLALFETFAVSQ